MYPTRTKTRKYEVQRAPPDCPIVFLYAAANLDQLRYPKGSGKPLKLRLVPLNKRSLAGSYSRFVTNLLSSIQTSYCCYKNTAWEIEPFFKKIKQKASELGSFSRQPRGQQKQVWNG